MVMPGTQNMKVMGCVSVSEWDESLIEGKDIL